jgi:hypothetical protein
MALLLKRVNRAVASDEEVFMTAQTTIKPSPNGGPASSWSRWWRRGSEIGGWVISSVILILLPKCPLCIAGYIALFSGIGISVATASHIRTSTIILCSAVILCLSLKMACRLMKNKEPR